MRAHALRPPLWIGRERLFGVAFLVLANPGGSKLCKLNSCYSLLSHKQFLGTNKKKLFLN